MADLSDSRGLRPVVLRLLRNPLGAVAAALLIVMVLLSALAPMLPLPHPDDGDLAAALQGPSSAHLLGTDTTGRDILSRLLWGGRTNLLGGGITVLVALAIGVPAGLLAGYYGRAVDAVGNWVNNLIMALPGVVVLLAVRAVFGPSIWLSMMIFGVILAPSYFRVVRATVQAVRNELYIDAAIVAGLGDLRILGRHVLTMVRAPIIIQSARVAVIAVGIQAGLEFIGIGDPTVASWGGMLNEGFRRIAGEPLLVLWPSLAIGVTSIGLVLLANALRDALEMRTEPPDNHPRAVVVQGPEPRIDEPDESSLLQVSSLRVGYGTGSSHVEVVRGVSLSVRRGEVLGLVGESGSGKSQTAFAVLDLLPPGGAITGGSIRYDGRDLATVDEAGMVAVRGAQIGYVPQEPMTNLDPSIPIGHQLAMPMRKVLGISRAEATERALHLLDRVGIADPRRTFHAYPFEVSGGMAQRVLIAGAVSCAPQMLITDEPTTALDVTVQAEVLELLRELQREQEMALLIVTHDFGVVADICDNVAVMHRGQIVETGSARQVLGSPQHPYTQELLDAMLDDDTFRDDRVATR
jgi:peptide/nickel transport system permease protein